MNGGENDMMQTLTACELIAQHCGDAVLVATMRAMRAFDQLGTTAPRINSVPLMGGAASLGLGLALARPAQRVIVVDGDGSLLMQLGGLVTVSGQQPRNFVHFVVHNGSQFTGGANLQLPGNGQADFPGLARAAGYRRVETFCDRDALAACIGELLACEGPVFVELRVQAEAVTLGLESPQTEMPDRQFKRMGDEARLLKTHLERAQ